MIDSQQIIAAHINSSGPLQPQPADGNIPAVRYLDAAGRTERFMIILKPVN